MPELLRSCCRNALLSTGVITVLALASTPLHAQTASPDLVAETPAPGKPSGIDLAAAPAEIVITAERRSTNLQKTPLAVTALSADTLDKSNVTDFAGLNGLAPGLNITKSSGFETIVTIRGVGSETPENAPVTSPGVALFIDGVYIANTISMDQSLFDLDHIEVLRGPQGSLYGESATGGAISLLTKQPQLGTLGASGDVTIGNYNLHRERAEFNAPIGDKIAVRASLQKSDHDGFTRNTALPNGDLDDLDDVSGKLAILFKPTDNFTATLTGQLYSSDQNGAAQKNVLDPNSDPRVVTQDYPSKFNLDTQLYHLNLQWDGDLFSIKSVSAYQHLDHRQKEDGSRSAYSVLGFYDDLAAWNTRLNSLSQEFDILSPDGQRLEWVAGIFAQKQKSNQFVVEFNGSGVPGSPGNSLSVPPDIEFNTPFNVSFGQSVSTYRESYAGFGQATYHITDDLRATGGGRFNYDSTNAAAHNFSAFSNNFTANTYVDRKPTWRAELDYDLTKSNMIYVSVAEGYKPGGVNPSSTNSIPRTFGVESNTAYEIGSKNQFLDHKLRLNLAAFFYNYKNMQFDASDTAAFSGGIANIPSIHIWGGEAEAAYQGMEDHLHLGANLAVEQGEVQGSFSTIDPTVRQGVFNTNANCQFGGQFFNPLCFAAVAASATSVGGNTPAKLPDVSGSINIAYDFSVLSGILTPRAEFIYRGGLSARIFNNDAIDSVKSYGQLNLNVQYIPNWSDNVTAMLSMTNVTDEAGVNSRYSDPFGTGQLSEQYIPPFQVLGTVSYTF